MALYNLFGAIALDQSVMATTPLLKAINTTLQTTPYVYVVNPSSVSQAPVGVQNVNIANVSTPPTIQSVSLLSTPIVISYQGAPYTILGSVSVSNFPGSFSVSNFPGVQNVNVANPSTPPASQNVVVTSTPIVSILNTNVGVNNWPTTYPTQGVVNVNIANVATPATAVSITSTPVVSILNTNVGINNLPATYPTQGIVNVNIANVATPATAVAITSTPVVSILNTNVGVNNWPATYPTQGIVNVNLANVSTPASIQNVALTSTPIVIAYQGNANYNVNITSTPIVYAQIINQTSGGAASNVNVTNFPATQNVAIVSTPIVYAQIVNPSGAASNVTVSNFPGIQNVNLANVATPPSVQNVAVVSTPVVSILNTNVGINNWPTTFQTQGIVNVNVANPTTPLATVSVSTPITYAYQPYPYYVQGTIAFSNTSINVGNLPGVQNVNIANPSTPPLSQNVVVTSTPVVSILNTNVGVNNWPSTFQTQGVVNVNLANVSTPPTTQAVSMAVQSTPIVVISSMPSISVTPPGMQNVNIANVSTPPAIQPVSITSTPVVSILNTNVGVNNWPTTYPTQGVVNVNVANVATPATSVAITSTPIVISYQGNANYNVNVSNVTSTPIVYSYQPFPYSIQGNVGILSTPITITQLADPTGNIVDTVPFAPGMNAIAVGQSATSFYFSSANSTVAQLAAAATFTGTIESIVNQQAISILVTSDQVGLLTLNQYIDAAGTRLIATWSFTVAAGVPYSRSFTANGNYFNLTFKNNGGSTTTTLRVDTAYGTLPSTTNLGNDPVCISEVAGVAAPSRTDGLLSTADQGTVAAGVAISGNPVRIGGSDGSLAQDINVTAKAVQGTRGVAVQDLKDSGRTSCMINATVASTATGETLIAVSKSLGLAATTSASSNTITTGKRFRIQAIVASVRNSTGTVASNVTLTIRAAVAGATTTSSPIQFISTVPLAASAVATLFPDALIPDGFEIDSNSATNTWGVTITHPQWVTGTQVATFQVSIVGYEY